MIPKVWFLFKDGKIMGDPFDSSEDAIKAWHALKDSSGAVVCETIYG